MLLLVAAFGFVVPNGFFIYWLVNEFNGFGPVLQDNLALGFILDVTVTLILLTVYFAKHPLARITFDDLAAYRAAVSDSGFQTYQTALLGAFVKRMADIRQTRDSARAEVQRLRRKATDLAHAIGSEDDTAVRMQAHAINVGLPVFAVVFITLLFAPRVYRSPELQQWIFTSGILLELTTLVMIVAGLLVLALAGKVNEAVSGTVLGGVLGYGVGRGASRRAEVPMQVPAAPVAPVAMPVTATARRI